MKRLLSLAAACLLLCTLALPALANDKGMIGGLYDIVSDDNAYDGYTSAADSGNERVGDRHVNQAILTSRYHNQLLCGWRNGKVWELEAASTTAVYQPGDELGEYPDNPRLTHTDDGFCLRYGDKEEFVFVWEDGEYVLERARFCIDKEPLSHSLQRTFDDAYGEGYLFWQSGEDGSFTPIGDDLWRVGRITLKDFNISQLPRSLAEVRRSYRTLEALEHHGSEPLTVALHWQGTSGRNDKLPVYSAPDEDSYRAANGKASVSIGGAIDVYGQVGDWTLISYQVSGRTSRFGFFEGSFLSDVPQLVQRPVSLVAACDTFLTDDPLVSQYAQAYVPAGTVLQGYASLNAFYAWVSFEQEGEQIRGFVPAKDVYPEYDYVMSTGNDVRTDACDWDAVTMLVGKWDREEGSDAFPERLVIENSGGYAIYARENGLMTWQDSGNVRITPWTGDTLYNGMAEYELSIIAEDNSVTRYGVTIDRRDGTITLHTENESMLFRRHEYSTFGNG